MQASGLLKIVIKTSVDLPKIPVKSFCTWHESLFGQPISAKTIYDHKDKGFDWLNNCWKIKYICFWADFAR